MASGPESGGSAEAKAERTRRARIGAFFTSIRLWLGVVPPVVTLLTWFGIATASTPRSPSAPVSPSVSSRVPTGSPTPSPGSLAASAGVPPSQVSGPHASGGLTAQVAQNDTGATPAFTVTGTGCKLHEQIDIYLSKVGSAPDYILSQAPACEADGKYELSYQVDANGMLATFDGTHVALSRGSSYRVRAHDMTSGEYSQWVTFTVG